MPPKWNNQDGRSRRQAYRQSTKPSLSSETSPTAPGGISTRSRSRSQAQSTNRGSRASQAPSRIQTPVSSTVGSRGNGRARAPINTTSTTSIGSQSSPPTRSSQQTSFIRPPALSGNGRASSRSRSPQRYPTTHRSRRQPALQITAPTAPARRATSVLTIAKGQASGSISTSQLADLFKDHPELNDNSIFNTLDAFQKAISILMKPKVAIREHLIKPGSMTFLNFFKRGEMLFENKKVPLRVLHCGNDFQMVKDAFEYVYLVKNKDGFGMEYPDDLSIRTLNKYIDCELLVGAHSSLIPGTKGTIPIKKILDAMNRNRRSVVWNMLSLEFTSIPSRLSEAYVIPTHVQEASMVAAIEIALDRKMDEISHLKLRASADEKRKLELEAKFCERKMLEMPTYHNFLLLSMKDSFTDCHVDFSATAVYNHVITGKKIFYLARPTERNLRVYRNHEMGEKDERWLVEELFEEFRRVEICAGETAIIPAGYLHFVFTPEDSLVISGNYLDVRFLEKHFQLAKIEEKASEKDKSLVNSTFQGFGNVMWSYTSDVLIPKLTEQNQTDDRALAAGRILLKMDPTKKENGDDWYTEQEKEQILVNLEEAIEKVVEYRQNRALVV